MCRSFRPGRAEPLRRPAVEKSESRVVALLWRSYDFDSGCVDVGSSRFTVSKGSAFERQCPFDDDESICERFAPAW